MLKSGSMTSGTTAWKNAVRNVLALTVEDGEVRKLARQYTNYGGNDGPLYLRLDGSVFTQTEAPAGSRDKGKDDLKTFTWNLQDRGATDWRHGLTNEQAAELEIGPEPDEKDLEAVRVWQSAKAARMKVLRNKKRSPAWRALGDEQCQLAGDVLIWKWFAPQG